MGFKPSTSRKDAPLLREGDISIYLRRSTSGVGFYNIRDLSGSAPMYVTVPYEVMGARIPPRQAIELYQGRSLLEVELGDEEIAERIKNPTPSDLKHGRLEKWTELQAANQMRTETERVAIMGPLVGHFANGPSEIAIIPDGIINTSKTVNGITYHNQGLHTAFAFIRYSAKDVPVGLRFRLPVEDCERFVDGESASHMEAMLKSSEDTNHFYLDVSMYHRVDERIVRLDPRECLDLVRGNPVETKGIRFEMTSIEVKPSNKGGYYSNAMILGERLSVLEHHEPIPKEESEKEEESISM